MVFISCSDMHQRCPECGSDIEPDMIFCTHCGVSLNGAAAVGSAEVLNLRRKRSDAKKLIAVSVAILMMTSAAMLIISYSGSVDFDIKDSGSEIKITNTSKGSLEGFTLTIRDEMNFMRTETFTGSSEIVLDKYSDRWGRGYIV